MAGNVSEWTSGTFHESAYEFVLDMNPNLEYMTKEEDALPLRRKVVRGGSWKDISYFLQTGTRSYEYEDTARSYIGFRMAKSYLGVLTKNVKK
jgi:formylglycine-generating enzyme required for sulfatase activity